MKKSLFLSVIGCMVIVAGVIAVTSNPKTSSADPVIYTVSGDAFSDMPNTSDQIVSPDNHYGGRGLGPISMSGVTIDADGNFSGMANNAQVGTADFSGVSVDAGCLIDTTSTLCPVTGDFVFTAASDPQSGGWDGIVRMSDPSWNEVVTLGPLENGIRTMSGFAWGGDVVGWVDFSGVQVFIGKDLCTNLPEIQLTVPDGYVKDPAEPADEPGICSIIEEPVGCKIGNDPNYDETATVEDNTMCLCPNGDYNATTGECGNGPGNPALCPDGSIMPSSGVCPGGEADQCRNIEGFQQTVEPPYTQVIQSGVKNCYIIGCPDPYANNYNSAATMWANPDICTYDPGVETCKQRGNCPVVPKAPKKPIYIET